MADSGHESLEDDFWVSLSHYLAASSTQPQIKPSVLGREEIFKWHVMHGQAQTCILAINGNLEAVAHVSACPDCRAHFKATRGYSFSDLCS